MPNSWKIKPCDRCGKTDETTGCYLSETEMPASLPVNFSIIYQIADLCAVCEKDHAHGEFSTLPHLANWQGSWMRPTY